MFQRSRKINNSYRSEAKNEPTNKLKNRSYRMRSDVEEWLMCLPLKGKAWEKREGERERNICSLWLEASMLWNEQYLIFIGATCAFFACFHACELGVLFVVYSGLHAGMQERWIWILDAPITIDLAVHIYRPDLVKI